MNGVSIAYAQARIQSRYGQRADASVWSKLHNIQDTGSYLQSAQQTAIRPWVLGISATYSSHDVELALRQKYRYHVDEVASWMPDDWHKSLQWIKRLADLPVLQYLAAGGDALEWMKSDPDISAFTAEDPQLRRQAMHAGGLQLLVDAMLDSASMLPGWLLHWNRLLPGSFASDAGLLKLNKLMLDQIQLQLHQHSAALPTDYDPLFQRLRLLFRRYAFRPAGVCAYLAIVALDVHHLRSQLMQRILFQDTEYLPEGLPQ